MNHAASGDGCVFNASVVQDSQLLVEHSIFWANGKITYIGPSASRAPKDGAFDATGRLAAPGYVDLQVNGAAGVLFSNSVNLSNLEKIGTACAAAGSTTIFPTLISPTLPIVASSLSLVRAILKTNHVIGGLHIEGPFLDYEKAGVHDSKRFCLLDEEWMDMFYSAGSDFPVIITAHPDSIPTRFIPSLHSLGIRLMIGHSNSTFERAMSALSDGFTGFTHLFNAMSQFQGRHPGVVGAALTGTAYSTIVADGHHVDYRSISIAKRCIGSRLALVSDCMPIVLGGGSEFKIGPFRIKESGGRLISESGGLAGSSITLSDAVKNCVDNAGIDAVEAIRMASIVPAEIAGCSDVGRLEIGMSADINILSSDLTSTLAIFPPGHRHDNQRVILDGKN